MASFEDETLIDIAIMAGKSRELDRAADAVKARVIAEASRHKLTGAYIASIKIANVPGRQGSGTRVTDRLIYSDDPNAMSIEYGHFQGKRNTPNRKRMPGQHIFERAYAKTGWS